MLAQDLITRAPVLVDSDEPLREAARRMRDADVGSVVVMEGGEPIGILTDRDVAMFMAADVIDVPVEIVMTRHPVSISAHADVEMCLERMEAHAVRRILIVEDGRLIGVVSLDDILMHLGYLMGKASALVRTEIVGGSRIEL